MYLAEERSFKYSIALYVMASLTTLAILISLVSLSRPDGFLLTALVLSWATEWSRIQLNQEKSRTENPTDQLPFGYGVDLVRKCLSTFREGSRWGRLCILLTLCYPFGKVPEFPVRAGTFWVAIGALGVMLAEAAMLRLRFPQWSRQDPIRKIFKYRSGAIAISICLFLLNWWIPIPSWVGFLYGFGILIPLGLLVERMEKNIAHISPQMISKIESVLALARYPKRGQAEILFDQSILSYQDGYPQGDKKWRGYFLRAIAPSEVCQEMEIILQEKIPEVLGVVKHIPRHPKIITVQQVT